MADLMEELQSTSTSPKHPLVRQHSKAPAPSAALLALQEKGFELPSTPPKIKTSSIPQTKWRNSVSPLQSEYGHYSEHRNPQSSISPLSIMVTPRNLPTNIDKPLPLEPEGLHKQLLDVEDMKSARSRASSTYSTSTMVSNILNLYVNRSSHSFKSEYDDMTPYPDSSDAASMASSVSDYQDRSREQVKTPSIARSTSRALLHPKAYRDTVARLLEHQFSDDKLVVPPMPSPMSFTSSPGQLPKLVNFDAVSEDSIPAFDLGNEHWRYHDNVKYLRAAGLSDTSIQVTPEASPNLRPSIVPVIETVTDSSPSDFGESPRWVKSDIRLEVPDVREAESWYDQDVSPMSPDWASTFDLDKVSIAGSDNSGASLIARSSEGSTFTAHTQRENHIGQPSRSSIEFQRSLAFDALSPPRAKASPNIRPVSYIKDEFLPGPVSATVNHIVGDSNMLPAPLDIGRRRSSVISQQSPDPQQQTPSRIPTQLRPGSRVEPKTGALDIVPQDRNPSVTSLPMTTEGKPQKVQLTLPVNSTLTNKVSHMSFHNPAEHPPIPPHRPSSAFSSDSSGSDNFIVYDTLGGAFKAMLRDKMGKQSKLQKEKIERKAAKRAKQEREKEERLARLSDFGHGYTPAQQAQQAQQRTSHGTSKTESWSLKSGGRHTRNSSNMTAATGSTMSGVMISSRSATASPGGTRLSYKDDTSRPSTSTPGTGFNAERGEYDRTSAIIRAKLIRKRTDVAPHEAVPLTRYQKYGPEIWYESSKKKRAKEREERRKAAEKEEKALMRSKSKSKSRESSRKRSHEQSHEQSHKREGSDTSSTMGGVTLVPIMPSAVPHDLDAKKNKGVFKNLVKSSEEKRRTKIKDSIVIIGGGRVSIDPVKRRASEENMMRMGD